MGGHINKRNLGVAQRSCDQTFENQDLFLGIACTYDQLNKLLFLGGGYDTTKKEFSRQAQGRNMSYRILTKFTSLKFL